MPRQSVTTFGRLLDSKFVLVGEVTILMLLLVALGREFVQRHTVRQQVASLEQELGQLENRNQDLRSLVAFFQSDFFQEREGRLRLGLQKTGETAVAVVNDDDQRQTSNGTTEPVRVLGAATTAADQSNPQRWWNYFFSLNHGNNQ